MKRLSLIFLLSVFTALSGAAGLSSSKRLLLDSLAHAVGNFATYHAQRSEQLRHLIAERNAATDEDRVHLGEKIAHMYIESDVDSALIFYHMARADAHARHDTTGVRRIDMEIAALMPALGVIKESIEHFEQFDPSALPAELKLPYWRSAAQLYHSTQIPYPEGALKDKYRRRTLEAMDSLRSYYAPGSPVLLYLNGCIHKLNGDTGLAVASFQEAIPRLTDYPDLKDVAMEYVAEYYEGREDYDDIYFNYTLQRAIDALRQGVVRARIFTDAGTLAFHEGSEDLGRACVELAMEHPDRSYAGYFAGFDRHPLSNIFLNDSRQLTRTRVVYVVTLILLLVMFMILYMRLRLRLREANEALESSREWGDMARREATLTNQNLITLAFVAIEELKEYNLHISRKLKTGQLKDLIQEVDSGKYINRQNTKFFEVFDATFLSDFPNFVEGLNVLLQPDRRLELLPGDRLSPELRIAAFMRLGVSDSNKLAQVLGLSLNTIYTYRNRLKGRAINRDTFEEDVKGIHGLAS